MGEAQIDWQKARDLVLQRLHARYDQMSEAFQAMPTIVFQDPDTMETTLLSPKEAILEVNNLSSLGKKIIAAELSKLRAMQP